MNMCDRADCDTIFENGSDVLDGPDLFVLETVGAYLDGTLIDGAGDELPIEFCPDSRLM